MASKVDPESSHAVGDRKKHDKKEKQKHQTHIGVFLHSPAACCDLKLRMSHQMAPKVDPESSLALGNYKNMANYA